MRRKQHLRETTPYPKMILRSAAPANPAQERPASTSHEPCIAEAQVQVLEIVGNVQFQAELGVAVGVKTFGVENGVWDEDAEEGHPGEYRVGYEAVDACEVGVGSEGDDAVLGDCAVWRGAGCHFCEAARLMGC